MSDKCTDKRLIARPFSVLARLNDGVVIRDRVTRELKSIEGGAFAVLSQLRNFDTREGHALRLGRQRSTRYHALLISPLVKWGFRRAARQISIISEYIERYATGRSGRVRRISTQISTLESSRVLIEEDEVALLTANSSNHVRSRISSVVVPTRDRSHALLRCLESISLNRNAFSKAYSIIVSDDSAREISQQESRAAAKAVATRNAVPIWVSTRSSRLRLVESLEKHGFDFPMLEFALLGCDSSTHRYGANRNTLSLLTAGQTILSCDDDVVLSAQSTQTELLPVFDTGDPFVFRETSRDVIQNEPVDIVAAHEQYLGSSLAEALSGAAQHLHLSERAVLDIMSDQGQVLASCNGAIGDTGMWTGDGVMLTGNRRMQRDLACSDGTYRALSKNRNLERRVERNTIGHRLYPLAMCYGLHESISLPFFPIYRNEDGIFSALLNMLRPDGYVATLPISVLHEPCSPRSNHKDWVECAADVRFCDVLHSVLAMFQSDPILPPSPVVIGHWLKEIADLNDAGFAAVLRDCLSAYFVRQILYLTEIIDRYSSACSEWHKGLHKRRSILFTMVERDETLVPCDISPFEKETSLNHMKKMVSLFGQMLTAWSAMRATVMSTIDVREFMELSS